MASVKEQVGEVLLGTTDEPQLSALMRQTFMRHAKKADDGDYYLDEANFIEAVAPESEDYVNFPRLTTSVIRVETSHTYRS